MSPRKRSAKSVERSPPPKHRTGIEPSGPSDYLAALAPNYTDQARNEAKYPRRPTSSTVPATSYGAPDPAPSSIARVTTSMAGLAMQPTANQYGQLYGEVPLPYNQLAPTPQQSPFGRQHRQRLQEYPGGRVTPFHNSQGRLLTLNGAEPQTQPPGSRLT